MNEIRNKLIKMIPRSMRILTRKVSLRDVTEYETYFSINLILKRFYHINLKEKINVILISSEHTEVLDFALEKNILSIDRKSTRLNSSHVSISYAVFCLKKKKIDYPH